MKQLLTTKWMRWLILPVAIVAVAFLMIHLASDSRRNHILSIATCLQDAQGIHTKSPVAIAGVYVGEVSKVRAQPQEPSCPARIEMTITSDYELRVPKDSIVSKATAGVLGETYLDIDTRHAIGSTVQNGELLPSHETPQVSLTDAAKAVQQIPGMVEAMKSLEETQKKLDSQEGKTLPGKGIRPKTDTGK